MTAIADSMTLHPVVRVGDDAACAAALKRALEALGALRLPLAGDSGGRVIDEPITVVVRSLMQDESGMVARVGVFFAEQLPACSCGDDPEVQQVCGELRIHIDRRTGLARCERT